MNSGISVINYFLFEKNILDGLLKALRYGTREPCVTRSTTGLLLLSSEGLNNPHHRGTIEDVS
jgi:hypothetical protein